MTTKHIRNTTARPHVQPKGVNAGAIDPGWAQVYLDQNYVPARLPEGPVLFIAGSAIIRKADGTISLLKVDDIVSKGDVVMTSPDGIVQIQGTLSQLAPGAISPPSNVLGDGGELAYAGLAVDRINETVSPQTFSHAMAARALPLATPIALTQVPGALNHAPIYSDTGNPNFDPATGNYNLTIPEDTTVNGRVVATDPDGDAVSYFTGSNPGHGAVSVNPDGTWTYTPAANFNGTDSFTVVASDGRGGQSTSTITIGVTPVNDPPDTQNITANGIEDPVAPVAVQFSGTDVDNAVIGFHVLTLPLATEGVLYKDVAMTQPVVAGDVLSGPAYFMPAPNWNGTTTLSYAAIDAANAEDPTPATATIVISPVNDPPVVTLPTVPSNNGQVTTPEDTPYTFSGSGNTISLSDPDNTTASVSLNVGNGVLNVGTLPTLTVTNNGTPTVTISGPIADINTVLSGLKYSPTPDWNGSDLLTVTSTDPLGAVATGTKPITVTPITDSKPDFSVTFEDIPLVNVNLIQNDGFSTTPLSKVVIWTLQDTSPTHSASHFIDYGTVTQDPTTGAILSYTGGIPVYDSADHYAGQIISVSRVPQGLNEVLTFIPAPNYNNADPNGNPLIDPATGNPISLVVNYQVAPDYGSGQITAGAETSTWSIVVKMVNDPPVYQQTLLSPNFSVTPNATPGGPAVYEYNQQVMEDSTPLANASNTGKVHAVDVEDGSLTSGYRLLLPDGSLATSGTTAHGAIVVNNDGTWQYTPSANFNGLDSFQVQVSDSNGAAVNTTVKLGVTSVNDAPVFNNLTYTAATPEDTQTTGVVQATDVDIALGDKSQWLVYSLGSTAGMQLGSVVGVTQDGHWTYQPAPNFFGTESFQIVVNDNSGAGNATAITTVTVNVSPVNDPPVFITTPTDPLTPGFNTGTLNYNYSIPGNTAVITDKVSAFDVDGDPVTFSLVMAPNVPGALTQPVVNVNPDGTWSYTPAVMPAGNPTPFYVGGDSFAIRANDGHGGTATTTIQLDLTNPAAIPTPVAAAGVAPAVLIHPAGHVSALSLGDVLGPAQDSAWSLDHLLSNLGPSPASTPLATTTSAPIGAPTSSPGVTHATDALSAMSFVGPTDPLGATLHILNQTQQQNHHGGGA
ncbi:tandem-95 repeat protein [Leptothrix ochracea]|uniref:tandem-95 repeat protein n=2 Tax=Leptothrix ochracea TaxID=735331 RepID=UPI0034E1E3EC